jgi:hypothetical protein
MGCTESKVRPQRTKQSHDLKTPSRTPPQKAASACGSPVKDASVTATRLEAARKKCEANATACASWLALCRALPSSKTVVGVCNSPFNRQLCCVRALELDATEPDAWLLLAETLVHSNPSASVRLLGRAFTRQACLVRAIECRRSLGTPWYLLAQSLRIAHDDPAAASIVVDGIPVTRRVCLQHAVTRNGTLSEAWLELGEDLERDRAVFLMEDEDDERFSRRFTHQQCYIEAVYRDQANDRAWYRLGLTMRSKYHMELARKLPHFVPDDYTDGASTVASPERCRPLSPDAAPTSVSFSSSCGGPFLASSAASSMSASGLFLSPAALTSCDHSPQRPQSRSCRRACLRMAVSLNSNEAEYWAALGAVIAEESLDHQDQDYEVVGDHHASKIHCLAMAAALDSRSPHRCRDLAEVLERTGVAKTTVGTESLSPKQLRARGDKLQRSADKVSASPSASPTKGQRCLIQR